MNEHTPALVEWLAGLSERARTEGNTEHADRLLLLAWQAMDGDQITPEMLIKARAGLEAQASVQFVQPSVSAFSPSLCHPRSNIPMIA